MEKVTYIWKIKGSRLWSFHTVQSLRLRAISHLYWCSNSEVFVDVWLPWKNPALNDVQSAKLTLNLNPLLFLRNAQPRVIIQGEMEVNGTVDHSEYWKNLESSPTSPSVPRSLRRVVPRPVPRAVPLSVSRSVPCFVSRSVPCSVSRFVPRSVLNSVPRSVPCFILFIVDKKGLSSIFSSLLTGDNWTCSTPLISYRSKICWKAHWPKIKRMMLNSYVANWSYWSHIQINPKGFLCFCNCLNCNNHNDDHIWTFKICISAVHIIFTFHSFHGLR